MLIQKLDWGLKNLRSKKSLVFRSQMMNKKIVFKCHIKYYFYVMKKMLFIKKENLLCYQIIFIVKWVKKLFSRNKLGFFMKEKNQRKKNFQLISQLILLYFSEYKDRVKKVTHDDDVNIISKRNVKLQSKFPRRHDRTSLFLSYFLSACVVSLSWCDHFIFAIALFKMCVSPPHPCLSIVSFEPMPDWMNPTCGWFGQWRVKQKIP